MKNALYKKLKPIKEVQIVRGVELPVGLGFRQLVVTGPPGAGKTHYINQIRGWPNEGYIDLSRKGWWRDQSLIYRPREINLGIPYKGRKDVLTVFDQEWREAPPQSLHIDYQRIRIPPPARTIVNTNWRDRYIFEFLLPEPQVIYERRRNRQKNGFFPVDSNLTLEEVARQVATYCSIALYLHRAGVHVYVRHDISEPPMLISEKGDPTLPPWAVADARPRPNLKTVAGWRQLLLGQSPVPWFSVTNEIQDLTEPSRIPHDGKSLDIIIGQLHLRLSPEIPMGASKSYLRFHRNWIVRRPGSCSDLAIFGFARICPGETVTIGRSNRDYDALFSFSKEIAKRHLVITNVRGDLLLRPISSEPVVRVVRLDDLDSREQMDSSRVTAMRQARSLLGGRIALLDRTSALALILEVNEILASEAYRPLDGYDMPGGLVELPDEQTPVIIGDLHAQVDNLLKILTENCLIQALQNNRAFLCILGDAVHSENIQEMERMESSILIMDLILSLKRRFPTNVFYLRGNHDDFDPELAKNGIAQGLLFKKALEQQRGSAYVEAMQTFYHRLPHMIVSPSFIAVHAGPPRAGTNREQIVQLRLNRQLAEELTKNRLKRPYYLSGYGKADVKALRQAFNLPKSTPVIVGHTPLDPFGSVWQNVGAIKNHHIVSSSHQDGPACFVRISGSMVPLTYAAEPLTKLINKLKHRA
ncbi:metallophosphoesterase [Desulfofustis limnaeus]|jgi:hypothetical protein|uniref:protein-serine/threonine phosphatase n=1 Tax=Desulfofustis limnaeus TaxID=2740163 RepID=A0ABN6M4K2_9BACT|nr:metallophosphoesterase [Desulfofustis limnaeus]MDX9896254.1 metallophosphoesterase [Desulfofustis sp.]BDD87806.1 hypothetical protein DPPLL_21710 [Desulfofustis limnaeus]